MHIRVQNHIGIFRAPEFKISECIWNHLNALGSEDYRSDFIESFAIRCIFKLDLDRIHAIKKLVVAGHG